MKNKKIEIVFVTILGLLLIIISTLKINEKEKIKTEKEFSYTPLMYQICDDDSCIYLLGSIHMGDDRVNKLSDVIIDAYNKSDYLAVELDVNDISLNIKDFMLEDGIITDYISNELNEKLIEFSKNHPLFPYDTLKYLKLGYIYDYMSLVPYLEEGYKTEGVDSYFINLAYDDDKEIISLEKYEDQLNLLLNYSDDFYIKQLEELIDNYEEAKDLSIKLYDAYLSSNEQELKELINEDTNELVTEEEQQYIKEMLETRNTNMTNKIEEFLESNKKVFMTVGCAHVIGNNGIIELLSNNYKITKIK